MTANKTTWKLLRRRVGELASNRDDSLHVMSRGKKWIVIKDRAKRASGIYRTKSEAVRAARQQINSGMSKRVYVHNAEGKVADEIMQ